MRFFRRKFWDRERERELDAYLDIETDHNIARGMPPEEARDAARRKLGNQTQIREEIYRMNTIALVESILTDLRYALRQLRRAPGFAASAILSLALGIGANTAIFSLLDQILLRWLPVKDPSRLVLLNWDGPVYSVNAGGNVLSYPMYKQLRDHNQVFSGLMARHREWMGVRYNGQSERAEGEFVSGNYFDVLGIGAAIGRTITPADDTAPGAHPVAVLSHDFWVTRFRSDPAVIGSTIYVNGTAFTVIGVSQAGFAGIEVGSVPRIRIPIAMHDAIIPAGWTAMFGLETDGRWLQVFGRLQPGVTIERAKAAVQPLFHSILYADRARALAQHPIEFTDDDARKAWLNLLPASKGPSDLREYYGVALRILMAMVGLVLLIACSNVANLLLARAAGREREMAARLALGAGSGRLIRQSLVESLLLSLAGGAIGLALAAWCDGLLLRLIPSEINTQGLTTAPDPRILAFTIAISMLTGILFGIAPALHSTRIDLTTALKEQARTLSGAHARFRRSLTFAQIFLSAALLIGVGLFVQSLRNLQSIDPGFRVSNLAAFSIDPGLNGYSPNRTARVLYEILDRLHQTPGIDSAGLSIIRVLDDWWGSPITVEGYKAKSSGAVNDDDLYQTEQQKPPEIGAPAWAVNNGVSPGYFATLGIPILEGRDFTLADASSKHKVALINETFARRFFAGRSPLGRRFGYGSGAGTKMDLEIIGVVKDSKYGELREVTPPQAFVNAAQIDGILRATFYVKARGAPQSVFPAIRTAVTNVDPDLAVLQTMTMSEELRNNLSAERMVALLASVFGALAAFLAAVGLYGLLAFNVVRRTREFGIRTALGASRGQIVWLVLKDVLALAALGIAAAIPAAIGLMRLAQSLLYGIRSADPKNIAAAVAILIAIAAAAAYLPTIRASRVDPARALRYE
jgi:predicted permease